MLESLRVKNFALIEEAQVDFGPGLNILSGETGAGKSILIDAIAACLGGRAGGDQIRSGAEEAYIELVFSVSESSILQALDDMDVHPEEGLIVIKRRITAQRSQFRINDESAGAAFVQRVTELLLDIHGQHEHQSLLKNSCQLALLDDYAGAEAAELKTETARAWQRAKQARQALTELSLSEEERLGRLDFLNYEIQEIEAAAVQPGERDRLKEQHRELAAFESIEASLAQALQAISEGPENADNYLMKAYKAVSQAERYASTMAEVMSQIGEAQDILSEAGRSIHSYLEETRYDPQELKRLEQRLDELNRLELKYGDLCLPGNEALEKRLAERSKLEDYGNMRMGAQKSLEEANKALQDYCEKLSALRTAAANRFDRQMKDQLKSLNFLSVDFETNITPLDEAGPGGRDALSFHISLNPGEPLMPLNKVASGGELSRIMLAIKTILAHQDQIPSVIFDEIDSGISGRTAAKVGEKLKEIARYRQVLLITHLPQIAAMAERHYEIRKNSTAGRTVTEVKLLNQEEAVEEIARLMGGESISEQVLEAARSLKESV